jgi:DNA modification methylase
VSTLGTARVLHGNALDLPLEDGTVDLVVTSPPYFGLRSYQDGGEHYAGQIGAEATPAEFVDALIAATAEMVRVLKPGGSIFVNLGDKYANDSKWGGATGGKHVTALHGATGIGRGKRTTGMPAKSLMLIPERYRIRCVDDLGLTARAVIVWDKPNGMPESVTDRVRRSHEDWIHLTTQPRYFTTIDAIREEHTRDDDPRPIGTRNKTPRHTAASDNTGWKDHKVSNHALGKLPGSVWSIPTHPLKVPENLGVNHHAAFPVEWPLRLILGWSPDNGTVLDPFGGTGTTALAAKVLGREGISVDLSRDYCRLAEWRTNDPDQIDATRERARRHGHETGLTDTDDLGLFGLLEGA